MKLCILGEYPPVQSRGSRTVFWMSAALARQGWEVHVVTGGGHTGEGPIGSSGSGHPFASLPNPPRVHLAGGDPAGPGYWGERSMARLVTRAGQVVLEHGADLLLACGLQPYGIAAQLVSGWTGVPYGVSPGACDAGRLFLSPPAQTCEQEVVRAAAFVLAGAADRWPLRRIGVSRERIHAPLPQYLPEHLFHPGAPPLDVNAAVADGARRPSAVPFALQQNQRRFSPELPTIGLYNRLGRARGHWDVLHALGRLRQEGLRFNLLVVEHGAPATVEAFVHELEKQGLAADTWLLPPMPHWQIPSFIRACTAVCCLERDFPAIHTASAPEEVLACGGCLIVSRDVLRRYGGRARLSHGRNAFVVDTEYPDHLAPVLRRVIQDPVVAGVMGKRGHDELSPSSSFALADYGAHLTGLFRQVKDDIEAQRHAAEARRAWETLGDLRALSAGEEARVLAQAEELLLRRFAGRQAQSWRRASLEEYSLLARTCTAALGRLYERFHHVRPALPGDDFQEHLLRFVEFVETHLAGETRAAAACGADPIAASSRGENALAGVM